MIYQPSVYPPNQQLTVVAALAFMPLASAGRVSDPDAGKIKIQIQSGFMTNLENSLERAEAKHLFYLINFSKGSRSGSGSGSGINPNPDSDPET